MFYQSLLIYLYTFIVHIHIMNLFYMQDPSYYILCTDIWLAYYNIIVVNKYLYYADCSKHIINHFFTKNKKKYYIFFISCVKCLFHKTIFFFQNYSISFTYLRSWKFSHNWVVFSSFTQFEQPKVINNNICIQKHFF